MEDNRALKYDQQKSRVDLVTPRFIEEIGLVLAYGAKKYDENNWRKGIKWMRIYGSALRHLLAWAGGEDIDKGSGLPHLAHAATNLMFLIEYSKTHQRLDNRPNKKHK